jgi:pimeloyl-ACP methyl ester carboxylesterase
VPALLSRIAVLLFAVGCSSRAAIEEAMNRPGTCAPTHSVRANGVELEYVASGPEDGPPLLLIMGLAAQLTAWPQGLVDEFEGRGFRVIRFDNRDVGRSTHLRAHGQPGVLWALLRGRLGLAVETPYSVGDMADDAAGLIEALSLGSAHVVGVSLGGMIAQELALRHPTKVRSLTSIMSTPGDASLPEPATAARNALLSANPPERAASIERGVKLFRAIGSPGFPLDETSLRERLGAGFDRCYDPDGGGRQLLAVLSQRDRTPHLASLSVPALVVHGRADPLVPVEHGIATHKAIPVSELLVVEGMGHDLPREVWRPIADGIARLATLPRADAGPR